VANERVLFAVNKPIRQISIFATDHKMMKASHSIKLLLLFNWLISCAANPQHENQNIDSTLITQKVTSDAFERGKIINFIPCLSDKTKSYALYIPATGSSNNLPIVYFFDPHADGVLPLQKYKSLADTFHFILVGSNDSKNGNDWNDAENIWNIINVDIQKRLLPNTNRIYTAGFSGGAKVATFLALQHPQIKGVIADGAVLPDIGTGGFQFSFTGIAGNGDMNESDLISINKMLDKTAAKHRLILFNGKHEWAPETVMNTAFAEWQFDAMCDHSIPTDTNFINDFISKNQKSVEQNLNANNLLKAKETCQLVINMLQDLTGKVNWFQKEEDAILKNPAYQKQSIAAQNILIQEENIKSGYERHFQNADENYWKQTIEEVGQKAKSANAEGAMYQRLEAYLSLAFYSFSNQLISAGKNKEASYFVDLYKDVDPGNSEAWYFSAILNERNNNSTAAKADLLKAVSLGFNDKKRLETQAEFQKSLSSYDLSEIESKMK
jgi:hypothetical protein